MPADYYKTLSVDKSASADEIKRAYRKLAHEYHPDKKGGNEAKFKEINEAYQVLSDPQKRSQYDQFGASFQNGPFGGGQNGGYNAGGFDFSDFGFGQGGSFNMEDIFEMFGGGFGRRGARHAEAEDNRGADLELRVNISFYTSARGGIEKIELARDVVCETCYGNGAKPGSEMITCSTCKGSGEVKETVRSIFGNMSRAYSCRTCKGSGRIPRENCPTCRGEGRVKGKKSLDVTIPGGIRDGESLVVKGQGQAGFRGGQTGDLYIRVGVESDRRFKRVNEDIYYNLNLKITSAILGGVVRVPTLDGEKEIEIPSGAQDGEELRLKGLGVHGRRKGDQVVKIKIEIPRKLSGKAKKLIEELSLEI